MKLFKKFQKISRISVVPPIPNPMRHGMAIGAIVKDEAPYLAEWIRYHQIVGVRAFYIYDNGSTDGTAELARALIGDAGAVIPFAAEIGDARLNRPIDSQSLAYTHAIGNFGADFRWMAFIDPDEFIQPIDGDNIVEILDTQFADAVNLSLPWFMFGTNGHEKTVNGLTLEHFTSRYNGGLYPLNNQPFKAIMDPTEVTSLSAHAVTTRRDARISQNTEGLRRHINKRRDPAFFSGAHLRLHHYFTRSREEMLNRKLGRGRFVTQGRNYNLQAMEKALDLLDAQSIHDGSMQRFVPELKQRIG